MGGGGTGLGKKGKLNIGKPFPSNSIDLLDYPQSWAELAGFVESSYCLFLMLLSLKCTFIHRMCVRSGVRRASGGYLCSFLIRILGKHRVLLDTLTVYEGHGKDHSKASVNNIITELPRGVSWDL